MEKLHFHMFSWQELLPMIALPAAGVIVFRSPVGAGWSGSVWLIVIAVALVAAAAYGLRIWRRGDVQLDDDGMTLHLFGTQQTWPYEKLWQVKQVGKYRVRMCFDPELEDKHAHMHITIDIFGADAFVDALLDGYEDLMGHELPPLEPEQTEPGQAAA